MPVVPSVPDSLRPRLALRQTRGELIEMERILAAARVVLALCSLVAVYFDSEPFRHSSLVDVLLLVYCAHAISLFGILRFRSEVPAGFSLLVHATDILWPTIISLFTNGPNSPFFLYFIFALLAAAFRWGMREALFTAVAAVATIAAEAIVLTYGSLAQ